MTDNQWSNLRNALRTWQRTARTSRVLLNHRTQPQSMVMTCLDLRCSPSQLWSLPLAQPTKGSYWPKPLLTLGTVLDCSSTNDGGGITHPSMVRSAQR